MLTTYGPTLCPSSACSLMQPVGYLQHSSVAVLASAKPPASKLFKHVQVAAAGSPRAEDNQPNVACTPKTVRQLHGQVTSTKTLSQSRVPSKRRNMHDNSEPSAKLPVHGSERVTQEVTTGSVISDQSLIGNRSKLNPVYRLIRKTELQQRLRANHSSSLFSNPETEPNCLQLHNGTKHDHTGVSADAQGPGLLNETMFATDKSKYNPVYRLIRKTELQARRARKHTARVPTTETELVMPFESTASWAPEPTLPDPSWLVTNSTALEHEVIHVRPGPVVPQQLSEPESHGVTWDSSKQRPVNRLTKKEGGQMGKTTPASTPSDLPLGVRKQPAIAGGSQNPLQPITNTQLLGPAIPAFAKNEGPVDILAPQPCAVWPGELVGPGASMNPVYRVIRKTELQVRRNRRQQAQRDLHQSGAANVAASLTNTLAPYPAPQATPPLMFPSSSDLPLESISEGHCLPGRPGNNPVPKSINIPLSQSSSWKPWMKTQNQASHSHTRQSAQPTSTPRIPSTGSPAVDRAIRIAQLSVALRNRRPGTQQANESVSSPEQSRGLQQLLNQASSTQSARIQRWQQNFPNLNVAHLLNLRSKRLHSPPIQQPSLQLLNGKLRSANEVLLLKQLVGLSVPERHAEQLVSVLKDTRNVRLDDPKEIQHRLLALSRRLGIPLVDAVAMACVQPNLMARLPSALDSKIKHLESLLNLDRPKLAKLVKQTPVILELSAVTLSESFMAMQQVLQLPDHATVAPIILTYPRLLAMNAASLKTRVLTALDMLTPISQFRASSQHCSFVDMTNRQEALSDSAATAGLKAGTISISAPQQVTSTRNCESLQLQMEHDCQQQGPGSQQADTCEHSWALSVLTCQPTLLGLSANSMQHKHLLLQSLPEHWQRQLAALTPSSAGSRRALMSPKSGAPAAASKTYHNVHRGTMVFLLCCILARCVAASSKAFRRLQYLSTLQTADVASSSAAVLAASSATSTVAVTQLGRLRAASSAAPMGKVAGLGAGLLASDGALVQVGKKEPGRGRPPSKASGVLTVLTMPEARFEDRFPGYQAWLKQNCDMTITDAD